MEQERSVVSSAAPSAVWSIWSDPEQWPEWNPFVTSMKLEGPFVVGTGATMVTKRGSHHVIVTELLPGTGFALEGPMMPGISMIFRCRIAPLAEGGSRISQGVSMRGPLAALFFPMMGKPMADTFVPILEALAAKAEGRA